MADTPRRSFSSIIKGLLSTHSPEVNNRHSSFYFQMIGGKVYVGNIRLVKKRYKDTVSNKNVQNLNSTNISMLNTCNLSLILVSVAL